MFTQRLVKRSAEDIKQNANVSGHFNKANREINSLTCLPSDSQLHKFVVANLIFYWKTITGENIQSIKDYLKIDIEILRKRLDFIGFLAEKLDIARQKKDDTIILYALLKIKQDIKFGKIKISNFKNFIIKILKLIYEGKIKIRTDIQEIDYNCPLTLDTMQEPVLVLSQYLGMSFERYYDKSAIVGWLQSQNDSLHYPAESKIEVLLERNLKDPFTRGVIRNTQLEIDKIYFKLGEKFRKISETKGVIKPPSQQTLRELDIAWLQQSENSCLEATHKDLADFFLHISFEYEKNEKKVILNILKEFIKKTDKISTLIIMYTIHHDKLYMNQHRDKAFNTIKGILLFPKSNTSAKMDFIEALQNQICYLLKSKQDTISKEAYKVLKTTIFRYDHNGYIDDYAVDNNLITQQLGI